MTLTEARLQREIDRLRDQLAELSEVNSQLMDTLRLPSWECPAELGLTWGLRNVLAVLVSREVATHDMIRHATSRDANGDNRGPKIAQVLICLLRKRLAPHGLEIETVRSVGYRLTPETRARLKTWRKAA